MKPIHEFNDFLKKQIGNLSYFPRKNGLNLENLHFCWKRVSLRENVSLRVCLLYIFWNIPQQKGLGCRVVQDVYFAAAGHLGSLMGKFRTNSCMMGLNRIYYGKFHWVNYVFTSIKSFYIVQKTICRSQYEFSDSSYGKSQIHKT